MSKDGSTIALLKDPSTERVLDASTSIENSILISRDGGDSFDTVFTVDILKSAGGSPSLTFGNQSYWNHLATSDDLSTLLVSHATEGIMRSTDFGQTWQKLWVSPA